MPGHGGREGGKVCSMCAPSVRWKDPSRMNKQASAAPRCESVLALFCMLTGTSEVRQFSMQSDVALIKLRLTAAPPHYVPQQPIACTALPNRACVNVPQPIACQAGCLFDSLNRNLITARSKQLVNCFGDSHSSLNAILLEKRSSHILASDSRRKWPHKQLRARRACLQSISSHFWPRCGPTTTG